MNSWVLLSLCLAHIIADFYFQEDKFFREKAERKVKSPFMYLHALVVGTVSWMMIPELAFWKYVLLIVGSHWLIDVGKAYLSPTLWAFLLDQLLHFVILFLVATHYASQKAMPLQYLDILPDIFLPGLLLAVLFCMKPTNILIKLILERYQIGEASSCQDIKNAGGLIGNLERMLTLLFVLIGQFEAIGFIVAAKSLLRFKDTDTAKTEYVLAGTFLSFGIAVACGLAVKYLVVS